MKNKGQTTVEYLLIIAVIVVVISVIGQEVQERLPGSFKGLKTAIRTLGEVAMDTIKAGMEQ